MRFIFFPSHQFNEQYCSEKKRLMIFVHSAYFIIIKAISIWKKSWILSPHPIHIVITINFLFINNIRGVRKWRTHRIWHKLDYFLTWDSSKSLLSDHNIHKISSVRIEGIYFYHFPLFFSTFTWRKNLAHWKLLAF